MDFKIKRKIKPNLLNELVDLKHNRTDFNDFSLNFISNLSQRYNLMRHVLKSKELRKDEQMISIAVGQYISSIVTCWETYFRDTFVYVVEQDSHVESKINDLIIQKGLSTKELKSAQLNLSDYGSKQYNFQDLSDTCNALNFLLDDNKNRITDFIDDSLSDITFKSPNFVLYWLQEKKDISQELYSVLEEGFEIRHKIVHDANYTYKVDSNFINTFEDCMVIFPQLLSISLAKKFNTKRTVYNIDEHYARLTNSPAKNEYHFVFSRKDFEGKYKIVD
ncbi:hypothetical protein ABEP18_25910 [Priestia megaterium]